MLGREVHIHAHFSKICRNPMFRAKGHTVHVHVVSKNCKSSTYLSTVVNQASLQNKVIFLSYPILF